MNSRYHSYSSYDQTYEDTKRIGKLFLLWAILRELPMKNFYARATVMGGFYLYLAIESWKCVPFFKPENAAHYYYNKYDKQYLDNYPMVKEYITKRVISNRVNPGLPESELWNENQFPSFYMHHIKSYRYILRNRRVVPWDGTFNQPIFPYTSNNDRSGIVHNGTNEIIERNPRPDW